MDGQQLPGAGDDELDRPTVTPDPAPSDDQLIKLAVLGGAAATLVALGLFTWLRKHLVISWRR